MSDDLDLKEAAERIGIPPAVLHSWTWAGVGPEPIIKSFWKPRYRASDLDKWLIANSAAINRSVH